MYQDFIVDSLNAKQAKSKNGYVRAMDYAFAYAYGKDTDKAIEYLNKAFDERSSTILQIKVDYDWNFLRDDPRFKELVKKVGFPE